MRKKLLFALFCLLSFSSFAQVPTLQQKLYYTCKVWGFVKYFHSNVSTCNVNWDSVLISVLPAVRSAATMNQFNDALDTMLAAAGPMAISTTYFPDTLPMELKRNRDFSWIGSSLFRSDVRVQLDTIKNNFRPHAECWVEDNTYTGSYNGWLVFPFDSLMLNVSTAAGPIDADHRQLMLFKHWNLVRYFYPDNYVLDVPWDTTLYKFVLQTEVSVTPTELFNLDLNLGAALNDAHTYGLTTSNSIQHPPGFYRPFIRLQYIEGKYVVINTLESGVNIGDALVSLDGLTMTQWEDSLKRIYSAGNISVFRRSVAQKVLCRMSLGQTLTMVMEDIAGTNYTTSQTCIDWISAINFFSDYYYPADSLHTIKWTTLNCDLGYVNMGNLQVADVAAMYSDLGNKSAIIFDLRNAPNSTGPAIAGKMYPNRRECGKFTEPEVTYPGTFRWYHEFQGSNGNPDPYYGKVIILINEMTQSSGEFTCMILEAMDDVVKVGSQTAGADGNISYWNLTQDLRTGFSTLGVFYPNGDSTQRIGIVPDVFVTATRQGVRSHHDVVLEKAMSIVGCYPEKTQIVSMGVADVKIAPNPAFDVLNVKIINASATAIVSVLDITGRVLVQTEVTGKESDISADMDISSFEYGMYYVRVVAGGREFVRKFIKE